MKWVLFTHLVLDFRFGAKSILSVCWEGRTVLIFVLAVRAWLAIHELQGLSMYLTSIRNNQNSLIDKIGSRKTPEMRQSELKAT